MASIRNSRRAGGALAAFAAMVLGAALAGPAGAQTAGWDEQIAKEVSPTDLDEPLRNVPVKLTAKISVVSGNNIVVRGKGGVHLDKVPFEFDPALVTAGKPNEFNDGDNIRVFGYIPKTGPLKLVIKNIVKLGDDATLYRQRIASLEKAGDPQAIFQLGDEIAAEGKATRKQAQLDPIAREAYKAAIALDEKGAAPDWIKIAANVQKYLGDRQGALERLGKAVKPGEPLAPEARKLMEELKAVFYRGRWVLFEEMKRQEGFVDRKGQWVLRERAEFEDEIERQRKDRTKHRINLDDHYALVAKAGNIEIGMHKHELAQAIGFPEDVDRVRAGNDIYDAWRFEGRGSFYFENDVLFRRPDGPR